MSDAALIGLCSCLSALIAVGGTTVANLSTMRLRIKTNENRIDDHEDRIRVTEGRKK